MNLTSQQKKEILCAYLPHGVEVESDKIYKGFRTKLVVRNLTNSFANGFTISSALDYEAKLILRHPDDMTEDELTKLANLIGYKHNEHAKWWLTGDPYDITFQQSQQTLNYLHSIHIDTFGAIEGGWAIRKENN